ncbi:MAG: glycosyltransferase, partial [Chloroflexi bacterium]|nr:glycosyltransferase [Chloroflexota bacterium]
QRIVVLIPAYNSAETISATLDSLATQREIQRLSRVYVADDASSDGTVQLCRACWKGPVPLHLWRAELNLGQQSNVNRALTALQSDADWVLMLHADDMVKQGWLASLLHEIDHADQRVASICTSWDNLFADGSVEPGENDFQGPTRVIHGTRQSVRNTLLSGCWWHISGCAIRTTAFADVGPFDESMPYMADWDWLLRCLEHGWSISYVPRSFVLYRLHERSVAAVSLLADLDISESLRIAGRYAGLLSVRDVAQFHGRRASFALRRMLRALQRRQPSRLRGELTTLASIGQNMRGCLRAQ